MLCGVPTDAEPMETAAIHSLWFMLCQREVLAEAEVDQLVTALVMRDADAAIAAHQVFSAIGQHPISESDWKVAHPTGSLLQASATCVCATSFFDPLPLFTTSFCVPHRPLFTPFCGSPRPSIYFLPCVPLLLLFPCFPAFFCTAPPLCLFYLLCSTSAVVGHPSCAPPLHFPFFCSTTYSCVSPRCVAPLFHYFVPPLLPELHMADVHHFLSGSLLHHFVVCCCSHAFFCSDLPLFPSLCSTPSFAPPLPPVFHTSVVLTFFLCPTTSIVPTLRCSTTYIFSAPSSTCFFRRWGG
mmetsp:Transcript_45681/g.80622  ORF Transcript_45681/g.80622 Transcript_45681/m.80622 type:complete len:296 (+) Transcript_45681:1-888(+)